MVTVQVKLTVAQLDSVRALINYNLESAQSELTALYKEKPPAPNSVTVPLERRIFELSSLEKVFQ